MRNHSSHSFQMLTLALLFIVLLGYILYIGQNILLPIFVALIVVYVLVATSAWLGKQPVFKHLPEFLRRIVVLVAFTLLLAALVQVVINTAEQIIPQVNTYKENIIKLLHDSLGDFGIKHLPNFSSLWEKLSNTVNLQSVLGSLMGTLSSLAGWLFMVVIYAGFMIAERSNFADKMTMVLPGERGEQVSAIVHHINHSIGDYLAIKTLINVILGFVCVIILLLFGIDFALFWAILIALLNYIPYVGAIIGIAFPVLLSMAQFGSITKMLLLLAILSATQAFVGNVLEPKFIGKKVNMSPFIVMVALTLWSSLWGIAGAILAIPLTEMIIIVLSAFASTKPLAIFLANDIHALKTQEEFK